MYYDHVNDDIYIYVHLLKSACSILLVSKMGQIIKIQRPVSSASYYRPVCDIRGRIYNSVAGGIIVQIDITGLILSLLLTLNITVHQYIT